MQPVEVLVITPKSCLGDPCYVFQGMRIACMLTNVVSSHRLPKDFSTIKCWCITGNAHLVCEWLIQTVHPRGDCAVQHTSFMSVSPESRPDRLGLG